MEEDRYSRQDQIITRNKYQNLRIAIIGCGAIGGNLAEQISRAGLSQTLYLIDPDNYETHNINRQKNFETDTGKNKAEALADYLKQINSQIEYIPLKILITKTEQLPPNLNIIFSCVDNYHARLKIQDYPEAYIIDGGTNEQYPTIGTTIAIHPDKKIRYEQYVNNLKKELIQENKTKSCSERPEPAIITTTLLTATIMTQRLIDWIQTGKHEPRMSYQTLNGTYKINWFPPNELKGG